MSVFCTITKIIQCELQSSQVVSLNIKLKKRKWDRVWKEELTTDWKSENGDSSIQWTLQKTVVVNFNMFAVFCVKPLFLLCRILEQEMQICRRNVQIICTFWPCESMSKAVNKSNLSSKYVCVSERERHWCLSVCLSVRTLTWNAAAEVYNNRIFKILTWKALYKIEITTSSCQHSTTKPP